VESCAKGRLDTVNDSLNKPKGKFGIDYRLLMLALFIAVIVFLAGSVAQSSGTKVIAFVLLLALLAAGKVITSKDDKMFNLWCLSLVQSAHYDPGKK
jgi:type IV secretory pathway VirB3-like protein